MHEKRLGSYTLQLNSSYGKHRFSILQSMGITFPDGSTMLYEVRTVKGTYLELKNQYDALTTAEEVRQFVQKKQDADPNIDFPAEGPTEPVYCRDCNQQLLDFEINEFGNRCKHCAHWAAQENAF